MFIIFVGISEAHSEPIFTKRFAMDVWQGSEYVSDIL